MRLQNGIALVKKAFRPWKRKLCIVVCEKIEGDVCRESGGVTIMEFTGRLLCANGGTGMVHEGIVCWWCAVRLSYGD